jgi:chlorobactene glucosyltransferase
VWSAGLVLVSAFRLVNHLRIAEGRMHEAYLKRAALRAGLWLGAFQVGVLFVLDHIQVRGTTIVVMLAAGQLLVAAGILLVTIRNIIKSKHVPVLENFADRELPTVTVAIPARNETADLEDCLRSILANNYPKFEVLVLDDCSHDRTPDIIKEFAQEGVRFVKGAEPQERWLAKNQAYDKLADEANGDILLFCGTDVRFGPETIRALVTTQLSRKKDMMSILPRRLSSDAAAAFIQPMRYWWELALPRRYFNRPSVLSTCWLIRRKTLKKLGGFNAVQHAILPEGYFAREIVKTDGYSFVRADDVLDVQTRKGLEEQRETAVRMRYPQLRRRLEWVLLLTAAELLFLAGPFVALASGLWHGSGFVPIAGALACLLLVLTHVIIVQVSNPANVLVAAFNLPLVILTELFLSLESMYKYEFSTVDWKGRNICIPVMHVIPKLPDIKS